MLQILSGRHPWSEIKSDHYIIGMIFQGCSPPRPDGHPAILDSDWNITQKCLQSRPELRPSADEVLDLVCTRTTRTKLRNFIIFGEAGVGKSSLVNLITGDQLAKSSSGAQSCTLQSTEYPVTFSDPQLNVNLFDTVGLDSPTMNNAGYLDALAKAHELIVSLRNRGGVHGLLFCMKAGRVSNTVQQNYKLFFEFLCQEQVPLALVVTNLENEESMVDEEQGTY
ncbi:hypothetical protein EDB19DRAFT_1340567 [Suillus lakei]|nr:hypothetical protein EDB19DRAFT_1340567 [Suillus lakei]